MLSSILCLTKGAQKPLAAAQEQLFHIHCSSKFKEQEALMPRGICVTSKCLSTGLPQRCCNQKMSAVCPPPLPPFLNRLMVKKHFELVKSK